MSKGILGLGVVAAGLLVGVVGLATSLEVIDQGHVGVQYSRSEGVLDETLPQGWNFVSPFVKVTQYPVALETVKESGIQLSTKDGKPILFDITYNYSNDIKKVGKIYDKFKGAEPEVIEENFLKSRLKDAALSVTSKYTVLEVFQKREEIKTQIEKVFADDVVKLGFIVSEFMLGTPVPDAQTTKAIQNVVNAQQKLEQLTIEKQQAQVQAEKQKIEAEGKAQAKLIEAKAESQANKLLQQSLTSEIVQLEQIKKWNGVMPTTNVQGNTGGLIIGQQGK